MGRARIKLRNTGEAANYYLARPKPFSPWFKVWLWCLGLLGKAKKYEATETDPTTRVRSVLHGYAYKGVIYLTKQEVFTPTQAHMRDMERAFFGSKKL